MPEFMTWRARVPRLEDFPDPVHDGDTLWLETDQGDWLRKVRDIRLKDVHAPELDQLGGTRTRQFTIDWIARWNAGPWPFQVDTYRTGTYRDVKSLERFVSVVWDRDRSHCLNADVQQFVDVSGYPPGN